MEFTSRIEYRDGTVREWTASETSISLALEFINKVIALDAVATGKSIPLDSIVSISVKPRPDAK